jgi:hypothetical protein
MVGSRYSEENPPPQLLESVRERLAGVCADWPRPLFEQVTARAAWIEFKYDRAMTEGFRVRSLRATSYRLPDADREETPIRTP